MYFLALLTMCIAACPAVEIVTSVVDYADGETALRGYLAKPVGATASLPGVVVVHEWWGCNDYAKQRARELAERGFAAFAIDMYGVDKTTTDPKQAGAWATPLRQDRDLLLRRARAGIIRFKTEPGVDGARLASIGFCFGGTVSLELARAGEDLKGVVSLHGALKTSAPATKDALKAQVLVLHGGSDPSVPPADVAAFFQEMITANARWRFEAYGQALHAFTNPAAKFTPGGSVAYDADAEGRAMAQTWAFLAEVLH